MLKAQDLSNLLNRNGGNILDQISEERLDEYLFLKEKLSNGGVQEDSSFRDRFRSLYALNKKRISQEFKDKFFSLMDRMNAQNEVDFKQVCNELYGENEKFNLGGEHFGNLTKLAHAVNVDYPIFEKPIGEVFEFKKPSRTASSTYERLSVYLRFYSHVRKTYRQVIEENMSYDLLKAFQIKFKQRGKAISPIKRMDLLTRTAGDMYHRGALI
ncbi:hypothetical protein [Pontibacter sp. G13]|uniref:hypothetical protein n=1 Tax=Pontibacter sp. G13 TaxID=3074898 RepID=UPI00288A6225|nr:hypothetical protein [Pontibacter sp. G13]WNJ17980.1 hypothetical protein RJD25_24255 [Pontibacter sp. G13]